MSKRRFIDSIKVTDPCTENWEEMVGNEEVRFCAHCAMNVHNLSVVTRKEAERIVRRSRGRLCVRYMQNPHIATPLFSEQMVQITRRVTQLASTVMSTSIALSTVAFSQLPAELPAGSREFVDIGDRRGKEGSDRNEAKSASIPGSVVDPQGALVPGATVVLISENEQETQTTTDESGEYSFQNVTSGRYTINITSRGFATQVFEDVTVSDGEELRKNASLQLGAIGGAIAVRVEYKQPIISAADRGDLEAVRELIARGADANAREEDETTALMVAVRKGSEEIVRLLLDSGADVNAQNEYKETALMQLDDDASIDVVKLLLTNGAEVGLRDDEGNTALILAASFVNAEILRELLAAGAEVNDKNKEGKTALLNAAYSENLETVRVLLLAGADADAKDNEGQTAYDQTSEDDILQLLLSFGATRHEKPKLPDEELPQEDIIDK